MFGRSLLRLLGDFKVPPIIMKLFTLIEMNGLYSVGIYRKAGAAARCRQLIADINANPGKRNDAICIYKRFPANTILQNPTTKHESYEMIGDITVSGLWKVTCHMPGMVIP